MAEEEKVNREEDRLGKLISGEEKAVERKVDAEADKAAKKAAKILENQAKNMPKKKESKEEKIVKKSSSSTKKKKKDKSLILATVALALVVIFVVGTIVASVLVNSGVFNKKDALKSEHYTITNNMLTILIKTMYNQYVSQYGDYLGYMGLDTGTPLADQTDAQGNNWLEAFRSQAATAAEQMLVWNEAARANGFSISDEDKAQIDETVDTFKEAANTNNVSLQTYFTQYFGEGVTEQDLRDTMMIQLTSTLYQDKCKNELKYTEDEIRTYAAEHEKQVSKVDYYTYTFLSTLGADATEEQIAAEAKANEAAANALAENHDTDSFLAALREVVSARSAKEVADEEASATETTDTAASTDTAETEAQTTEEKIANKVETYMNNAKMEKISYGEGVEYLEWLFDDARKAGDTKVFPNETDHSYQVVIQTKPKYHDESITKNARHILLSLDQHNNSAEECMTEAQKVLEMYKAGDQTEEYFGELAKEYTNDTGSQTRGGLYENIAKGDMVTEFEEWVFDDARKNGDVDIVESSYGAHVMYYIGDGYETWLKTANDLKVDEEFTALTNNNTSSYPVTRDDAAINSITM